MRKEDIEVALKDDVLTVSGRREGMKEIRQDDRGRRVYSRERFEGRFQRSIHLPAPVKPDTVKARYEQGVLSITAVKEKTVEDERKRILVV